LASADADWSTCDIKVEGHPYPNITLT
jgi:hypothetical protein